MNFPVLVRSLRSLVGSEQHWRVVVYLIGSLLVAAIELLGFGLVFPLLSLLTEGDESSLVPTLERITGETDHDRLTVIVGVVVFVAFVVKAALTLAFRWWSLGFTFRAEAATSTRLLSAYLRAPYSFHLRRNSSEMLRNVNDAVSAVYSNALAGLFAALTESLVILAIVVVLAVLQPLLTLVAFGYFAIAMIGYQRLVRGRSTGAGTQYQSQLLTAVRIVQESLGGVKESIVRGAEAQPLARLHAAKLGMASARRQMLFLIDAPRYYLEVTFLAGVGVLAASVMFALERAEAVAILGLFLAAGFRVLPSLTRLLGAAANIRVGAPAVELVVADLAELEPVARGTSAVEPLRMSESIELRDIVFSFPDTKSPAIDHLDLIIPRGSSLAIVGSSGAGKSTLADLLLGLHRPDQGEVRIDGRDVWATGLVEPWQRTIGYVPQDVYLFDASLAENIAFVGGAVIDDDRLVEAISMAQLDDVVRSLSDGLDTEVGERGTRLSGGQRQRVGIARALYSRPDVLVFDEATSSLDAETEALLTDLIESLYGHTTIIIVTHRLSTVRNVDRVVFVDRGHTKATGTFDELLRSSPEFASMARVAGVDR